MQRPHVAVCLTAFIALAAARPGNAQEVPSVVPAFASDEWLSSDSPIEFRVNNYADGTAVAVFIGSMDVSALVQRAGDTFTYVPGPIRLPGGEQEVTVYQVGARDSWSEIGRIPIRVLTPSGFEQISYDPRFAIDNAGQVAEGHSADELAPARDTYQDFTFRVGFETQHVRPGLTVRSQLNTVGATNREQALRFGIRQDDAPKYDLADYLVRAETGATSLELGHVSAGTNRHLVNGIASRGIALQAAAGPLSAKLAAMNGSSIVGWSNPIGLGENGHRILSGEIGLDAIPGKPGALRLDATFVDGSVRPLTGFNQGSIVDAETSRGMGLQISASDPSGRLRLNGGYSRSEFDNIEDQTIARGQNLVIIRDETRNARFLDVSVDMVRGLKLGESTFASLSTAVRHERVDPLYRSVAAFTQSDLQQNAFDLTASVGPVSARYELSRRDDNLDDIPSILTTHTRSHQASLAMPLGVLVGSATNAWLPQLSYSLNRVHQFGEGVPENSGFSESHVPDQLSTVHGLTAQWYQSIWQLQYRLDRSTQDNRQQGRETADFERTAHTVSIGINPSPVVGFSIDGSVEEGVSTGSDEKNEAKRLGISTNVRLASRTAVTLFGSRSWTTDPFDGGADRSIRQVRFELSQGLSLFERANGSTTGQFFIRFAHQAGDLFGLAAGTKPSAWTINTGFNLSLF